MMAFGKCRIGAAALAALWTTAALGQPAASTHANAADPAKRSPFLGTWELDLGRMPDTYGPPPKRVTYVFEDQGSGEWQTVIDITAPDDSIRHMAIRYRRDGRMARGEGDKAEGDSASMAAQPRQSRAGSETRP